MCIRDSTRNSGYSESVANNNVNIPTTIPDLGSIQGATALKLDEEVREDNNIQKQEDLISGISLDNAAYFENNLNQNQDHQDKKDETPEEVVIEDISIYEKKSPDAPETDDIQGEFSPQLFSDEETVNASSEDKNDEVLKEEEEFEIPAFLRNQKF